MVSSEKNSTELYQNAKGYTWQCNHTDRIFLQFGQVQAAFKIQDFLIFRRKIQAIDIQSRLFDLSDEADMEWIEAPKKNFADVLTLCEIIQLRDLLDGTKFALELHSLLHEVFSTPAH